MRLRNHGIRPWEAKQMSLEFDTWLGPVSRVADEVAMLQAQERAKG